MKVFIVLAAFAVACASAGRPGYGPIHAGPVSTGHSTQFRQEDNYGNYQFGYDESHASGATSRREEQTNGVRRGSYALSDADGRQRTVNYVADAAGFRASIHTNEPGVEPKDPADVLINKEGLAYGPAPVAVAAPAPVFEAPVPVAPVATKGFFHARAPVAVGPAPLPLPLPLPVPVPVPAPAPLPVPVPVPVPVAGPAYGAAVPAYAPAAPVYEEAPAPRAFSYSFGSSHLAPVAAPAPVYAAPVAPLPAPAPIAGPAPIYQERLGY